MRSTNLRPPFLKPPRHRSAPQQNASPLPNTKLEDNELENPHEWSNDWDEGDLDWLLPHAPPAYDEPGDDVPLDVPLEDEPQPDPGDFWLPEAPWPDGLLPGAA